MKNTLSVLAKALLAAAVGLGCGGGGGGKEAKGPSSERGGNGPVGVNNATEIGRAHV